MDNRKIQMAYIENPDQEIGGAIGYEKRVIGAQDISILATLTFIVVALLTMSVQIWRLWAIWRATRYVVAVIILPSFLFIIFFVLSILALVNHFIPSLISPKQSFGIGITFYVLPPIAIFTTVLVITRLLLARRKFIKVWGNPESTTVYLDIAAMLVESYAADAIWSVASVIFFVLAMPFVFVLFETWIQVKIISLLRIIHRVSVGTAWKPNSEGGLSTICWDHTTRHTDTETMVRPSTPPPHSLTSPIPEMITV